MKISQSFREDSIVGRCDIVCRDRMIHKKLIDITTSMKKSTIQPSFLEDSVSGRVFASAKIEYSTKKWFRTNKFIITIIRIMIIGQFILPKKLQTVQHDSELSEDFNASP